MPASCITSGPLQTERQSTGLRLLLRDLVVDIDDTEITIPEGTETDFSTIPWFGRCLVRWSKVDVAGVVHDRLYQTGEHSRWRADKIWRLVAVRGAHSANAFQAWAGWLALRLCGWWVWCKHRGGYYSKRSG